MKDYLDIEHKQEIWLKIMEDTKKLNVHPGMQEIVTVLHSLEIYTTEVCEGYLDKEPMFPYVKIAIPTYAEEALMVEQADQRAKNARNLLARLQSTDEIRKAEELSQVASREDVMHLAREAAEMRRVILVKHLPLLQALFTYLEDFYRDQDILFDRRLTLIKNGLGRVILKSQGTILQPCRTPDEQLTSFYEYQDEMHRFTTFLKNVYFSS